MKKLIQFLVIALVVVSVGAFIYVRATAKSDAEQLAEDWQRSDTEFRAKSSAMQAEINELEAQRIALKLGTVAGDKFRLCKRYPPTLEENKAKCQKYDEDLKKWDAEEKQHPSW
jgi:hypothetical protein